jgi:hypothetical protein
MASDMSLQEMFVRSHGQPIVLGERTVVQMDKVDLAGTVEAKIQFVGAEFYVNNAAVIAIRKPGKIFLSDGSVTNAVQIWDEPGLPRVAIHVVDSAGQPLEVYNKYRTRHGSGFVTEDSFTGNAGMIVTALSPLKKRYECSNGPGQFSTDLIFELSWKPLD